MPGILYGIWGSYHAQKAIRAIDAILPDTLNGRRPACFAAQVWSELLRAVEDSQVEGIALTGLIADLPKAFNHIPRLIVFEALALLGIPWSCLPHVVRVGPQVPVGAKPRVPCLQCHGST